MQHRICNNNNNKNYEYPLIYQFSYTLKIILYYNRVSN